MTTSPATTARIAATALVADDEPLLREHLAALLVRLWPGLEIVAEARNGREALDLFDEHAPDVAFLDVHMPGLNGVEAARGIGARAEIVFVTAYEQYAIQAFEAGAIDYVLKPFDERRLAETVARLQSRLAASRSAAAGTPASPAAATAGTAAAADPLAALLDRLAAQFARPAAPAAAHLQWIRASVGNTVRLVPVDEVIYLRSDEKYTLVVWPGGEALIRKTIRELADELDPERFVQIHRSVIVSLAHVSHVVRGTNETAELHLRGRDEVLPVSRSWAHQFRQM